MKTHNYNIDLMVPSQVNKDILFNEAQIKLDAFCNSVVIGFTDEVPSTIIAGEKYILTQGAKAGYICYCANISKGWQFLAPKHGMIMFLYRENNFFIFEHDRWVQVHTSSGHNLDNELKLDDDTPNFLSIENIFTVTDIKEYLYLYMQGNCRIDLSATQHKNKIRIILKQNNVLAYGITWSDNILWHKKQAHIMSSELNSMDIIELHPLAETSHFLGVIIGQNYQF